MQTKMMELISSLQKKSFLVCLFCELLGILIFSLIIKKIFFFNGIQLVAILLIGIPFCIYLLDDHDGFQLLVLALIPIFFFFYIFVISQHAPVGLQDPNDHLFRMEIFVNDHGNILFSFFNTLSSNFVALYCILISLNLITGLKYESLAMIIAPFFNILIIIFLIIISYHLHSKKIAALAAFFYGWDISVIILGQELRTQTPGLLLFIIIIYILMTIIYSNLEKLSNKWIILLLLLTISIIPFSFVMNVITVIFFIALIVILLLFQILLNYPLKKLAIFISIFLMFLLCLFYYLDYIGMSVITMLKDIRPIIDTFFGVNEKAFQTHIVSLSYTDLFGPFVHYSIYFFYLLFAASALYYMIIFFRQKQYSKLILVLAFSPIAILFIITNFFGIFSSSRMYIILLLMMAITASFVILDFYKNNRAKKQINFIQIMICILLVFYILINMLQIPAYIIGNEEPFRSERLIDRNPSWHYDFQQKSATDFIINNAYNSDIRYYIDIPNYYLQTSIYFINKIDHKNDNSIIIYRTSFDNKPLIYQKLLPDRTTFKLSNNIYANGDYIIFNNKF